MDTQTPNERTPEERALAHNAGRVRVEAVRKRLIKVLENDDIRRDRMLFLCIENGDNKDKAVVLYGWDGLTPEYSEHAMLLTFIYPPYSKFSAPAGLGWSTSDGSSLDDETFDKSSTHPDPVDRLYLDMNKAVFAKASWVQDIQVLTTIRPFKGVISVMDLATMVPASLQLAQFFELLDGMGMGHAIRDKTVNVNEALDILHQCDRVAIRNALPTERANYRRMQVRQ